MEMLVVSSILLWIVVVCNLILTLALVRRSNGRSGRSLPKEGLQEGEQAPDFTAETLNGEMATLATYAQREVAFVFVEPACGPCRESLPSYEALGPKASHSGVDLVLVSVADAERTRSFVEELNIQLPVLVAPCESNSFMIDYKLSSTPSYCLINGRSKIESTGYPSLQWGKWKELAKAWEANMARQPSLAANERR